MLKKLMNWYIGISTLMTLVLIVPTIVLFYLHWTVSTNIVYRYIQTVVYSGLTIYSI